MRKGLALAAGLVAGLTTAPVIAQDAMVVLDGSGSMWGQIDGRNKIVIARDVLADIIPDWPDGGALGLTVYGHRRKGDCRDIETVIDVGPVQPETFLERINAINPKGKTPLTDAVEHAAEALRYREEAATVVLVSDGIETCGRNPCEAAEALAHNGIDFTTHVIGFDVTDKAEQAQLRCLADATGGEFFTAADASELRNALAEVRERAAAPEPAPLPDVTVSTPETATVGTRFQVRWEPSVNEADYVTVVPADAKPDTVGNHERAGDEPQAMLRAPGKPGGYEVRYVSEERRKVLGKSPVEIVDATVELDAPEHVAVGTRFDVKFDTTVAPQDFLTIVPAEADDSEIDDHQRARQGSPAELVAPGEAGEYEVRYVLAEGRRTLARVPVTVGDATVTVQAPDTAAAGSAIEVSWSRTVSGRDILTVVPDSADDNEIGNHTRARRESPVTLRVPGEPGDYEVRYVLDEGRRVLGRTPIEVTGSQVTIEAPEETAAGSDIEVSWQGTVHDSDLITVVPADAPDDEVGNHRRARRGSPASLRVPGEPGDYEVRYVLDEGRRTLARTPIRATEPEVSVSAPAETVAGSTIEVTWQGTVHDSDFITVVPAGAPGDEVGNHRRARRGSPASLRVPGEPGDYEVRYVLDESRRTLTGTPIRATEPEVSVSAPAETVAGSTIEVTWQGTVHDSDFITVVPADAPGDEVGNHRRTRRGSPASLRVPGEPGDYEVRYVLDEGRRTLARVPVTATAPQVRLTAPERATAGDPVEIAWENTVHRSDYITIVPAAASADEVKRHRRAGEGSPITLDAPQAPGDYEVRYVLDADRTPVATAPLTVTEP
ncbi:VWA domain-containing protein [Arhodomonas sp. AD133]|uniref:VWA domain-containing protein n=1 Tax=Arhodomonas sp. AD133 TaxID=3415009 RepID=UPI003EBE99E1